MPSGHHRQITNGILDPWLSEVSHSGIWSPSINRALKEVTTHTCRRHRHYIALAMLLLHETTLNGPIQNLVSKITGQTLKSNQINGVRQDVAGMATAEGFARRQVMFLKQMVNDMRIAGKRCGIAASFKNVPELGLGWSIQQHLVLYTPEERLVTEILGRKVGREHKKHFEWNCYFAAGEETEIVYFTLQRHDPTVKDLRWCSSLPAEVIEQVNPIVCLDLEWRFVYLRSCVVPQVQHIESEFTAGYNERPPALHPAKVMRCRRKDRNGRRFFPLNDRVVNRVKDTDYLSLVFYGVRY